jgi:hypothetical protein
VLAERRDGPHDRLAARHDHRREQRPDRPAGRAHLAPPVPGGQLGVGGELLRRAQPRTGDTRLVQRVGELARGDGAERVFEDPGQLSVVGDPARVGPEPAVGDQVRPAQDLLAQHRPLPVVLDAEEHLFPPAAAYGP